MRLFERDSDCSGRAFERDEGERAIAKLEDPISESESKLSGSEWEVHQCRQEGSRSTSQDSDGTAQAMQDFTC